MTTHSHPRRCPAGRWRQLGSVALSLALGPVLAACDPVDVALTDELELDPVTSDDSDSQAPAGLELSSAEYRLSFEWGHAEPLDAGGWATVTDLGYRVEVGLGYLVTYSASLSPCTAAAASTSTTASLGERILGGLALPQSAFAGHASLADPSQIEAPTVEDLAVPTDRSFGALDFAPADYCWAHYLAAQADANTPSLPDDAELEGATLYLEGLVWLDDAHAEPFTVHATTASGVLVELREAAGDDSDAAGDDSDAAGAHATLTVVRDLAHAFDGFDFATDDPADLDRLVLRHLVQEATVELQRGVDTASP